jgi:flagellar basal body rod protein FlgG
MSTDGIYTSGLGALGQSARLDVIAHNLANVSTPGFRRDQVSFREALAGALDSPGGRTYNETARRLGGAPFIDRIGFDPRGGGTEATGRPLDLALLEPGFFTVQDPAGAVYYTRAGNFALDAQGRLVTADGRCQVLSEDGRGIALDPAGSPEIRVREDGALFQGEVEAGRLGIAAFDDEARLRKHGDTLFAAGSAAAAPAAARVAQGILERSSVNPVTEMVEMIKALRALESNLEMVRYQDAALDRAVNDFARLPR